MDSAGTRTVAARFSPHPGVANSHHAGGVPGGLQSGFHRDVRPLRRPARPLGDGSGQRFHLPPTPTVRHAGTRRAEVSGRDRRRVRPPARRCFTGPRNEVVAAGSPRLGFGLEAQGNRQAPRAVRSRRRRARHRRTRRTPRGRCRPRDRDGVPAPSFQHGGDPPDRRLPPPCQRLDRSSTTHPPRCVEWVFADLGDPSRRDAAGNRRHPVEWRCAASRAGRRRSSSSGGGASGHGARRGRVHASDRLSSDRRIRPREPDASGTADDHARQARCSARRKPG